MTSTQVSDSSITERWQSWAPYIWSLIRIVAAAIFITSGTTKFFDWPGAMPPGVEIPVFSQTWIGGWLEIIGGALLVLGLFTRPTAFLMSGMMAVAYFQFHMFSEGKLISFWPTINQGLPAMLYCFLWLYCSAYGPGPLSLEALRAGVARQGEQS